MTPQPWIPAFTGRPIDLVTPDREQVKFDEIAWALARINRYVGNAQAPVSVGLHTLIGLDLCDRMRWPDLRPHWLLHDAHEARLGDWATPVQKALDAVGADMFGEAFAVKMDAVRRTLADRHDTAIHAAARLALPTPEQREKIRIIDLRAMATERRDFLRPTPAALRRPWAIDDLGIEPGPKVWREMPPDDVAMRLMACFNTHLPALMPDRAA